MLGLGRTALTLIGIIHIFLFAQTNLVTNGDFSNDTSAWILNQTGNGQAKGSVINGSYVLSVQSPGALTWFIQFSHPNIRLDSGAVYKYTFDVSASEPRKIEANIDRNGGAYSAYSGDTISLTKDMQHFTRFFSMKYQSDSAARITFNCGLFNGNVTIDNVNLQKITAPTIKLMTPVGGEQLTKGLPLRITWLSVGDLGKLKLECSTDNGATWQSVSDQIENSGSYLWSVSGAYSPWCLLRLSSTTAPTVFDMTAATFEIIPSVELIRNGYFLDSTKHWNLGLYGGMAAGKVIDGKYVLTTERLGTLPWQIQLTQSGVNLVQGQTYVLSFTASAAEPCTIDVVVSMSSGAYTNYSDTSKSSYALTTTPMSYILEFPMLLASDTNARVDFDFGLTKPTVYLDKVSMTMKAASAIGTQIRAIPPAQKNAGPFKVARPGRFFSTFSGPIVLLDVLGRRLRSVGSHAAPISSSSVPNLFAPGIYIAGPEKQKER